MAAHNVHENVGRFHGGGKNMILYVSLVYQYDFEHPGKDDTGLGIWVVMVFQGYK